MSTQETKLKAIADAIREKDGTTAPIPANDFPARIRAIETSGGLPEGVRTITLTADPPEGGTVSGGGVVQDGMKITVSANNGEGYSFSQWQENGAAVSNEAEFTFTTTNDRTLTAAFEKKKLPEGYTELVYIQTQAGTGIEADVSITPNTTRVVCDIEPVVKVTTFNAYIFCGYAGFVSSSILALDNKSRTMTWAAGQVNSSGNYNKGTFTYNLAANTRIAIDMDGPNKKIKMGASSFSFSPVANTSSPNLIFGWNSKLSSSTTAGLQMKIYSAQIYVNNELKGEFVPCKNSSGKVGLYNTLTSTFCSNKNTNVSNSEPAPGPAV